MSRQRTVFGWDCCRCGDKMTLRASEAEVRTDQRAHVTRCPARRAPWELHIFSAIITDFDA